MNCSECSYAIPKNRNRCPSCKKWNVFSPKTNNAVIKLCDASELATQRYNIGPLNNIFNGGLVISSVNLIAGAPGAGKSTVSLQCADELAHSTGRDVLMLLSEESAAQVKDRSARLRVRHPDKILCLSTQEASPETRLHNEIDKYKPVAVIVDSLSGITDDLEQQVVVCKVFKTEAMKLSIPFIIINHVNKQDDIAGLRKLEHVVDGCFLLNIDEDTAIRLFKVKKNRFGPNKVELFKMHEYLGLVPLSKDEMIEMGLMREGD